MLILEINQLDLVDGQLGLDEDGHIIWNHMEVHGRGPSWLLMFNLSPVSDEEKKLLTKLMPPFKSQMNA